MVNYDYESEMLAVKEAELKQAREEIELLREALKPGQPLVELKRLRDDNKRYRDLLTKAITAMGHALHLGYCGEGSTKGMVEDVVQQIAKELNLKMYMEFELIPNTYGNMHNTVDPELLNVDLSKAAWVSRENLERLNKIEQELTLDEAVAILKGESYENG